MSEWPEDLPAAAHRASRSLLKELKGVTSTAQEPKEKDLSPVTLYVRNLGQIDGATYFTASEVASQLGVSVQAIRKYAKQKVCGHGKAPSNRARFGRIVINLYTPEDVEALREFLKDRAVVWKTSEEESD